MSTATEHDDPADAHRPASPTQAPRSLVRRPLAPWPCALFAAAVARWTFWGQGGGSGPSEGEPERQVPRTAGEAPFDLSTLRGDVVVLAFWATWCRGS